MEKLICLSLLSLRGVQAFVPLGEPRRESQTPLPARARRQVDDYWSPGYAEEEEYLPPWSVRREEEEEDVLPWLRPQSAPVMWHPDYSPDTHTYQEYSDPEEEEEYYEEPQPYLAHPPLLHENIYYEDDDTIYTRSTKDNNRALAAGLGTAALGFFVGGPVGAAVLGFSSAYAAENAREHTFVGDSARAIGDVALAAGAKGLELNEKHDVVEKTIQAAEEAWWKAQELDREYQIVQKAKDVAIYGGTATLKFVQEHNLVERSVKGLGQGIGWISQRVAAGSLDGVHRDRKALKDASTVNQHRQLQAPKQRQLRPEQPRQLRPEQPRQIQQKQQKPPKRTSKPSLMPSDSYESSDFSYNDYISTGSTSRQRPADDDKHPRREGERRPRRPRRQPGY